MARKKHPKPSAAEIAWRAGGGKPTPAPGESLPRLAPRPEESQVGLLQAWVRPDYSVKLSVVFPEGEAPGLVVRVSRHGKDWVATLGQFTPAK